MDVPRGTAQQHMPMAQFAFGDLVLETERIVVGVRCHGSVKKRPATCHAVTCRTVLRRLCFENCYFGFKSRDIFEQQAMSALVGRPRRAPNDPGKSGFVIQTGGSKEQGPWDCSHKAKHAYACGQQH